MNNEERIAKLENYGQGYAQLQQLLENCPHQMWQFKAAPAKWSVVQVIVHLADIEANNYVRYRNVATKPGRLVEGVDADEWAGTFDYQHQNADEALELFHLLRVSNYKLLKSLPENAWTHSMQHTERGEITLEQLFAVQINHLNAHLNQISEIVQDWKASQNG